MKRRMRDTLSFRVPDNIRTAIESTATTEEKAIAEVARDLLAESLRSRGLIT